MEIVKLRLRDLQPSQFYISAGKLKAIVAALRAGLTAVPLVWDEDDLDWDMYRACVKACREKKILSPVDLLTRIIPEEDYREKWDAWCDTMQTEIEKSRR